MSAPKWLRDYWWLGLGMAVFAFGAWTAKLDGRVAKLEEKVEAIDEMRAIVLPLGRLACLDNPKAQTAGLPCLRLFDGLKRLP